MPIFHSPASAIGVLTVCFPAPSLAVLPVRACVRRVPNPCFPPPPLHLSDRARTTRRLAAAKGAAPLGFPSTFGMRC